MKIRNFFLFWCVCLFSNCKQVDNNADKRKRDNDNGLSKKIDTIEKKSFKGWELYSWFDKGWKFVLVEGTNRNKTIDEIISSKEKIHDVAELEKQISKLQTREIIVWMDGIRSENQQKKTIIFQKPPESIINRLIEVCKNKDIELLNIKI